MYIDFTREEFLLNRKRHMVEIKLLIIVKCIILFQLMTTSLLYEIKEQMKKYIIQIKYNYKRKKRSRLLIIYIHS